MGLVLRYRWELTPLLVAATARLAVVLLVLTAQDQQSLRLLFSLGVAIFLAIFLPRVRREGRPLLTALWLLVILTEVTAAARIVAQQMLIGQMAVTPGAAGLWFAVIGFLSLAVIIPFAASQATRGTRFAMLVAAAYLAPVYPFGFIDFIVALTGITLPASIPVQAVRLPWNALVTAPLALVAIGLIAHSFRFGLAMPPPALNRYVFALLVAAGVTQGAGIALPAVISSMAAGEWLTALGFLFLSPLIAIAQIALVLGLTRLFASLFTRPAAPVPSG